MKKAKLLTALMILASGLAFGQAKRFQLSLFGGVSHVFAYGSIDDYVVGSNDFPVTPAHTPLDIGASLAYLFSSRIGVELRGEYTAASSLSLSDPSDQDTVTIDSSRRIAASLSLIWELSARPFHPFLVVGLGADKVSGDALTALSRYGYEVTFAPPDKTLSLFADAGGGVRVLISPSLGAHIDLRYRLLFADPGKVHNLLAGAGLFIRF